jgi:hypothetical protein
MESFHDLFAVRKVSSRLPAVVPRIIPLPFDEILILIPILTTVEDVLNLVFKFIVHLDRVWRRRVVSLNLVPLPWG